MWALIIRREGKASLEVSKHPYQGEAIGIRNKAIMLDRRIQMLPIKRKPKNYLPIAWTAIVSEK